MSQEERKKQVIHVKDLIIQADQVHLEQPNPKRGSLFGRPFHAPRNVTQEAPQDAAENTDKEPEAKTKEAADQEKSVEEPVAKEAEETPNEEEEQPRRRQGFSWI